MCRRVDCERCGKPTYAGCGAHVEQVLAGVRPENGYHCRDNARQGTGDPRRAGRTFLARRGIPEVATSKVSAQERGRVRPPAVSCWRRRLTPSTHRGRGAGRASSSATSAASKARS